MRRKLYFEKSGAAGYEKVGADAAWSGSTLPDSTELLVPVPYDTLYPHFLCARMDAALGETDRYAGEQAQYNSILSGLAAGLRQENLPRRRVRWRWRGGQYHGPGKPRGADKHPHPAAGLRWAE